MNMILDVKERQRQCSAAALYDGLRELEQRALAAGLGEIALLIGCAKMALDDAMGRPDGEPIH